MRNIVQQAATLPDMNPFLAELTSRRNRAVRWLVKRLPPWLQWVPLWRLWSPRLRAYFLAKYAHTIPDPKTVEFVMWAALTHHRNPSRREIEFLGQSHPALWEVILEPYRPGVISIGAGTGYWEALIAFWGILVIAVDLEPPDRVSNEFHGLAKTFYPVTVGDASSAANYPHYSLFLAWPPPADETHEDMAMQALLVYGGDTLIYMGELWNPEQNGSEEFFEALRTGWQLVALRKPWRWKRTGVKDVVAVFERRQRN